MFSAQDLLDDKQEQRPKEEEGKQTVWEDEHNSEFDTNEDDRNQEDEDEEEMEERERAEEAEDAKIAIQVTLPSLILIYNTFVCGKLIEYYSIVNSL